MQTYQGSCHCGAVAFEIDAILTEFTTCDCSLCRKKNAIMTKVHESALRLLKGKNVLGLYKWNAHIAKHLFCNICGIYTFHRERVTPDYFGINVHCLNGIDISSIPVIKTDGANMSVNKNHDTD